MMMELKIQYSNLFNFSIDSMKSLSKLVKCIKKCKGPKINETVKKNKIKITPLRFTQQAFRSLHSWPTF